VILQKKRMKKRKNKKLIILIERLVHSSVTMVFYNFVKQQLFGVYKKNRLMLCNLFLHFFKIL